MKLFKLTWDVKDGEHEYLITDIKVFESQIKADEYGIIEEVSDNLGKQISKIPSAKRIKEARESACFHGRVYEFDQAEELLQAQGPNGLYEINLGRRLE